LLCLVIGRTVGVSLSARWAGDFVCGRQAKVRGGTGETGETTVMGTDIASAGFKRRDVKPHNFSPRNLLECLTRLLSGLKEHLRKHIQVQEVQGIDYQVLLTLCPPKRKHATS